MSITLCVEAHSEADDDALATENAPPLNVHDAGGWTLLAVLGSHPTTTAPFTHGALLLARGHVARLEPAARSVPIATWHPDQHRQVDLRMIRVLPRRIGTSRSKLRPPPGVQWPL